MLGTRHLHDPDTNSSFYPLTTRTPGKGLLKTPGRTFTKSRNAHENVAYYTSGGGATVGRKGKTAIVVHTPFHPATVQARKALQASSKPIVVFSRPLGEKTPFPNRHNHQSAHTPAPQSTKISKLSIPDDSLPELLQTPGALLRPSSTRRSSKVPRSSLGDSAGRLNRVLNFKTPATNGNHWDVSDGEIDIDSAEVDAEGSQDVLIEDDDEIEYMPPKVPEQPYEPPFALQSHKVIGKTLLSLATSSHFDDSAELYCSRDIEEEVDTNEILTSSGAMNWQSLELPHLEDDDPFAQSHAKMSLRQLPQAPPATKKSSSSSGGGGIGSHKRSTTTITTIPSRPSSSSSIATSRPKSTPPVTSQASRLPPSIVNKPTITRPLLRSSSKAITSTAPTNITSSSRPTRSASSNTQRPASGSGGLTKPSFGSTTSTGRQQGARSSSTNVPAKTSSSVNAARVTRAASGSNLAKKQAAPPITATTRRPLGRTRSATASTVSGAASSLTSVVKGTRRDVDDGFLAFNLENVEDNEDFVFDV